MPADQSGAQLANVLLPEISRFSILHTLFWVVCGIFGKSRVAVLSKGNLLVACAFQRSVSHIASDRRLARICKSLPGMTVRCSIRVARLVSATSHDGDVQRRPQQQPCAPCGVSNVDIAPRQWVHVLDAAQVSSFSISSSELSNVTLSWAAAQRGAIFFHLCRPLIHTVDALTDGAGLVSITQPARH